jgi:ATP-dependent DNA ligase
MIVRDLPAAELRTLEMRERYAILDVEVIVRDPVFLPPFDEIAQLFIEKLKQSNKIKLSIFSLVFHRRH